MPDASSPAPTSLNRQVLSLAVPALGALIAEPLFVLADSAMVGHLGAVSLAGLSLASTILTTTVGLFVFLAYATTATTARLFGAGRRTQGLRAGVDGMWLALLLGLGAGAFLGLGAPWLTQAMGAHGPVAQAAVAYLRASCPGLPGMFVVLAATGVLRGLLDTRTPFVVASGGAVLNVVVNAILLYGVGMGIAGSGAGTAIAQTAMALALARPILREARAADVGLLPHREGLRASLGSGTPLLIRSLSLRVAILATVWAATALGEVPLAAHQVVNALWTFAAFALDALAVAAQALIGTALGQAQRAGDASTATTPGTSTATDASASTAPDTPASTDVDAQTASATAGWSIDELLRRMLTWGAGTGVLIGVLMAAGAAWLPHAFTSDAGVIAAATPTLFVAASALPLAGVVYLLDGVLMGAGDGRYLAWAGLVTLAPYVPLALLIGGGFLPGATGSTSGLVELWIAFAWVFMAARGATTYLRARGTAWRH
ncbi:MATE family efflux transporter [Actinomyces viscosus]|uniref:MATE family efflux transporter n=1 Tax=Actinomyces viscosus TaxID=1656 RepID=UPI000F842A82|nr:MATE family efflux transporter [Actinomyces viscosus]TFH52073.1 MATE family efflux transporter [Actinomyces viscosus]